MLDIRCGDSLDLLRTLPENSVDAVVTDPPYGLTKLPASKVNATLAKWVGGERDFVPGGTGFMGRHWDRFVPPPALWDEVFRVLKPGGYLVSFAGARTLDLMGLSIRLAGFETKDILAWLRADSFNKSPHVLKSSHEPIVLAQKPVDGTIEQNIARWGTGTLQVEVSRTPYRGAADEAESKTKNAHGAFGTLSGGNAVYGTFRETARTDYNPPGRWPGNLLDEPVANILDERNPVSVSRKGKPRTGTPGEGWGATHTGAEHDDVGGPSRFFPTFHYAGRATSKERPTVDGKGHPTVKPLTVMDWLVRLVTPPGGVVLDPFAGSGATVESALGLGHSIIAFEAMVEHIPLIEQRIARHARRVHALHDDTDSSQPGSRTTLQR